MHWYWNQQRSLLRDNWTVSFFLRLLGILLFVGGNMLVVKKLIYSRKNTPLMCSLISSVKQWTRWAALICRKLFLWYALSVGIAVATLFFSFKTMYYVVPTCDCSSNSNLDWCLRTWRFSWRSFTSSRVNGSLLVISKCSGRSVRLCCDLWWCLGTGTGVCSLQFSTILDWRFIWTASRKSLQSLCFSIISWKLPRMRVLKYTTRELS